MKEFLKDGRLSARASVKVRACYNEVEAEDDGRLRSAQYILRTKTDVVKRIIAPNDGVGNVTLVVRVSPVSLPSAGGLHLVGFLWAWKGAVTGGVRLLEASLVGGHRTGSWSYKTAQITEKPQFFGLM